MVADVRVVGVQQMLALAKACERAGRTDLKVELKKEAQRFVRDNGIREAVAESALRSLPSGGGHVREPAARGRRKDGMPRKGRPRSGRKARKSVPLNRLVAGTKIKTVANFRGRMVGVYVIGSQSKAGKKRNLEAINRGIVRHPTFGRKPWRAQRVRAGFFDRPMEGEVAREFGQHMFRAFNNIRRQLTSGTGTGGSRVA